MIRWKRPLILLAAAGLVAVAFGGGGTFASFVAQTTNSGNSFVTGSLILDNQANSGTVCLSSNGANNANPNCSAVINTTDASAPWQSVGTIRVADDASSSIDGRTLYLTASGCSATNNLVASFGAQNLCDDLVTYLQETNGSGSPTYCWLGAGAGTSTCTNYPTSSGTTLASSADTPAGTTTSLSFSSLPAQLNPGDELTETATSPAYTFVVSSAAASGASSVSVLSQTTTVDIPSGTDFSYRTTGTSTVSSTGSSFVGVLSSAISTSSTGTSLSTGSTAINVEPGDALSVCSPIGATPKCDSFTAGGTLQPAGSGSLTVASFSNPTNALPVGSEILDTSGAPSSAPTAGTITSGSVTSGTVPASLTLDSGSALGINKGDRLDVCSGGANTAPCDVFVTSGSTSSGAASISLSNTLSPTPTALSGTLTVTDLSTTAVSDLTNLGAINGLRLLPVDSSAADLPQHSSRYFSVGLYLPSTDQTAQGLGAAFSLTWTMAQ